MRALGVARAAIETKHRPDGYTIGVNVGRAAGQTILHLHVHLIPRYEGDVPDPRGGVRHVIPGPTPTTRRRKRRRRLATSPTPRTRVPSCAAASGAIAR